MQSEDNNSTEDNDMEAKENRFVVHLNGYSQNS